MIEVNNLTASDIDTVFLKKVGRKVLKKENKVGASLSVALVESAEMKRLNKKYRGKDSSTDVLSFTGDLDFLGKSKQLSRLNVLGEVVISVGDVEKNASQLDVSFKTELARVLIHAILHILGYDHESSESEAELMEKKEDYYLSNILKNNNAKGKNNN